MFPKNANFFESKTKIVAYYSLEVFMREIALASQTKNKDIIEYLYKSLSNKLDFCSPIITNYCDNNFCYLLFACEQADFKKCEAVLRDLIIDYIEKIYKVNYLKTKIKNHPKDDLTFNAYIKVLSIFDKNTDENALRNIILFNQTFFVDSFLDFRLAPLKSHWDNLASLSSDNLTLFNSSTFLDVIRFLINTMDSINYKIKIIFNGKSFSVYIMKNKNSQIKKIAECDNTLDLISFVISDCPNYIDIYLRSAENCDAIEFLSSIFTNRLKIFSTNSNMLDKRTF